MWKLVKVSNFSKHFEFELKCSDKSHPVKKLSVSPNEVTVRAGGQLKLQCIFGGRPLPTIFWSKVDGELPKSRLKVRKLKHFK